MFRLFQTLAALFIMSFSVSALAAEAMKKYGEIYSGPKTEGMEIAFFEGKDEALVKIWGVNHEWDGRIMRVRIQPGGTGKDFVTTVDGADYNMIVMRNDSYEVYLPGYDENPVHMYFNREETEAAANPNRMQAYFAEQEAAGAAGATQAE